MSPAPQAGKNVKPEGLMKAAVLHGIGDLRVEMIPVPEPGDGEVVVEVMRCGVCGSDIGRILRKGTYRFPTVPGHEFAGRVVYDPEGKLCGTRAAVFPLLPCFRCDSCRAERYAQCSSYDYYGSRRDGGFERYLAVKRFNLVPLPDGVSYEEGAMCEPAAVGLRATKALGLKGGERVLVSGAGPVGLCTGMWLRARGAAEVFFSDIDARKLELAGKLGFGIFHRGDSGFDCAVEGTGAGDALADLIVAVGPHSRIVLLGNPGGNVSLAPADYQAILRKELTLRGTWNSSFARNDNDWAEVVAAVADGRLPLGRLITHVISLDELPETVAKIAERKEFFCKVMVDNER